MNRSVILVALAGLAVASKSAVAQPINRQYNQLAQDDEAYMFGDRSAWTIDVTAGPEVTWSCSGAASHMHSTLTGSAVDERPGYELGPGRTILTANECLDTSASSGITDAGSSFCAPWYEEAGNQLNLGAASQTSWEGSGLSGDATSTFDFTKSSYYYWLPTIVIDPEPAVPNIDLPDGAKSTSAQVCASEITKVLFACNGPISASINLDVRAYGQVTNVHQMVCDVPFLGLNDHCNGSATYSLNIVATIEFQDGTSQLIELFDGSLSGSNGDIIPSGDFAYFVFYGGPSSNACDGSFVVTDANQGIPAWTARSSQTSFLLGDSISFPPNNVVVTGLLKSITVKRLAKSGGGGQCEAEMPSPCPPCIADYNQDGGVDFSDFAAFMAAYEAGEPCADLNGDGGIETGDIAKFYSIYESGSC